MKDDHINIDNIINALNLERQAHLNTQKEFSKIYNVKTLIKIIEQLKNIGFVATSSHKEAYDVISILFSQKIVFYSPITKEFYTSNQPPLNKRIWLLYTIGVQFTEQGKEFDKELFSVLNEYIENSNLQKSEYYLKILNNDFYCIDFQELVSYYSKNNSLD